MEQNHYIDIDKSIYEICSSNPKISEILYEAGFHDITKPGMISTAGRLMTIRKGAALKKIGLDKIKLIFEQYGYQIIEK